MVYFLTIKKLRNIKNPYLFLLLKNIEVKKVQKIFFAPLHASFHNLQCANLIILNSLTVQKKLLNR